MKWSKISFIASLVFGLTGTLLLLASLLGALTGTPTPLGIPVELLRPLGYHQTAVWLVVTALWFRWHEERTGN